MTPRQKALAASSPALLVLVGSVVWALWDLRHEVIEWAFPGVDG